MGIPGFMSWLKSAYSDTTTPLTSVLETDDEEWIWCMQDGLCALHRADFLYLDLNGAIHACSHPEFGPPPSSTEERLASLETYLDRLVDMTRPRTVIYIAVDGVAPRAKLNEQRGRRFRNAQRDPPPDGFDPNCITPGTRFMTQIRQWVVQYAEKRCVAHHRWRGLRAVVDEAAPGEGEHKILAFMRERRRAGEFSPDTRHVLYGADSDLVLLGLSTREKNVRVLSERHVFGHERSMYTLDNSPFQVVDVDLLRVHILEDLEIEQCDRELDADRIIDDFIFVCNLLGNDYVPTLPFVYARDGGVTWLLDRYYEVMPDLKETYIVDSDSVNIRSFAQFVESIKAYDMCGAPETTLGASPTHTRWHDAEASARGGPHQWRRRLRWRRALKQANDPN